jgi:hypothetical protein
MWQRNVKRRGSRASKHAAFLWLDQHRRLACRASVLIDLLHQAGHGLAAPRRDACTSSSGLYENLPTSTRLTLIPYKLPRYLRQLPIPHRQDHQEEGGSVLALAVRYDNINTLCPPKQLTFYLTTTPLIQLLPQLGHSTPPLHNWFCSLFPIHPSLACCIPSCRPHLHFYHLTTPKYRTCPPNSQPTSIHAAIITCFSRCARDLA